MIEPEVASALSKTCQRLAANSPFYQSLWRDHAEGLEALNHQAPGSPAWLESFQRLPYLSKSDLLAQQSSPELGRWLTEPREAYVRFHQTSGTTTGRPLVLWDTAAGWRWMLSCWQTGLEWLGLSPTDRLFFPFSYGPFLGFWTAFEAASTAGLPVLAGGGMTTLARLRLMLEHQVTVLFATPTYAWHLAEVAEQERLNLRSSPVRWLIVAGEPGGMVPAVRQKLEHAWGAAVVDHYGLSEIGPVAFAPPDRPQDLIVLGDRYAAEIVDPTTGAPTRPGEIGELVLSNPGRVGQVLVRYRTGDLVRRGTAADPRGLALPGGILSRADDMLHLRGNNIYPSALENWIRESDDVAEYRLILDDRQPLMDLRIELEPRPGASPQLAERLQQRIQTELLFRVDVTLVAPGSLPRFEMKAKRLVRLSQSTPPA